MNQKNYSRNTPKNTFSKSSFNYNNILYALIIIIIVFIVVILINYIYHLYQEARLKEFGITRVIGHRKAADAYFDSVRQNDSQNQPSQNQPSQNNTSKVKEVNIGGNMIPCDILKPCRLFNPPPKDGCCPDGIAAIDKDIKGTCDVGAEYRASSEFQNALKMCGY